MKCKICEHGCFAGMCNCKCHTQQDWEKEYRKIWDYNSETSIEEDIKQGIEFIRTLCQKAYDEGYEARAKIERDL